MKTQRMKTLSSGVRLAGGITLALVMIASGAQAKTAAEQSCSILKKLLKEGGAGGAQAVYDITEHWSKQERAKILPNLAPIFERFKYYDGSVYLVDDFGAQYKEHLIVVDAGPINTVFLRVRYAGHKGNMSFVNINFNSKYEKIVKYPFAQKPVKLMCN